MPTLKYLDGTYECAVAIKGGDYIHLLDESGVMIVAFDEIKDFSKFTLTNGSYTSPTSDHDCYLAVIRDDGTLGRGGHKCSDIPMTAADLGAAPAGYGLGPGPKVLTGDDDINTVWQNGWYYWGKTSPANAPSQTSVGGSNYTLMRVTSSGSTNIVQEYWSLNTFLQAGTRRTCRSGEWTPLEYYNPPMELGVEYRTTDRIGGKPVYKKNDGGVIKYRLEDETEWKPYATAVGGARTNGTNTFSGNQTIVGHSGISSLFLQSSVKGTSTITFRDEEGTSLGLLGFNGENNPVVWKGDNINSIIHMGNLAANNIGQIVTGSYVGTGAAGIDNPNSLTFDKPPKWLVICEANGRPIRINQSSVVRNYEGMLDGLTTEYQANVWGISTDGWSSAKAKVSADRKTVYWYASGFSTEEHPTRDATAQLNDSGETFRYMAIL